MQLKVRIFAAAIGFEFFFAGLKLAHHPVIISNNVFVFAHIGFVHTFEAIKPMHGEAVGHFQIMGGVKHFGKGVTRGNTKLKDTKLPFIGFAKLSKHRIDMLHAVETVYERAKKTSWFGNQVEEHKRTQKVIG